MFFPPDLAPRFMEIIKPIWDSKKPDSVKLQLIWNMLTGLQGMVLSHILVSRIGDNVFAGPFRGMHLTSDIMGRHFAPALLGTYEWELHGAIEDAIQKPYHQILNIGCSFGYYSVGLAMRMPHAKIYAFDMDETAREQCKKMAEANNVQDRVIIGGTFTGNDYTRFAGPETLLVIDVSSNIEELLDPQKYPELFSMDVIVEIHDEEQTGLMTELPLKFAQTHDVRVIPNAPFSFPLDKVLGPDYAPDHFDNLIATWEGKGGPSPFGVFNRKQEGSGEQK